MIRTEDGGTTWSTVALPTRLAAARRTSPRSSTRATSCSTTSTFATPEHGWVVGEFGVIFTTADGGKTWTAQQSPVETTLFGVHFADAQRGWATGIEQVLLRTTDGGADLAQAERAGRQGVRARHLRRRGAGQGRLGDRRQRPAAAHAPTAARPGSQSSCRSGWRATGSAASAWRRARAGSSSAARGRSCSPTATATASCSGAVVIAAGSRTGGRPHDSAALDRSLPALPAALARQRSRSS